MSYQTERDDFIGRVVREGMPVHVAQLLLRTATGLQRRAELACSSEAADRDRVPCPAGSHHAVTIRQMRGEGAAFSRWPCLCDATPDDRAAGRHQRIPRIALQDWRAEERVRKALQALQPHGPKYGPGWTMHTQGDPRGYVLRVIPPSWTERNAGRDVHNLDYIGVPTR